MLDTNVVLAGLRSPNGASRLWLQSLFQMQHTLLLTVPLVLEYEEVLLRPSSLEATRISRSQTLNFIDALCELAEPVDVHFLWRPTLLDPDDHMVVEAAFSGQADLLLTFNERDFRSLSTYTFAIAQPGRALIYLRGRDS